MNIKNAIARYGKIIAHERATTKMMEGYEVVFKVTEKPEINVATVIADLQKDGKSLMSVNIFAASNTIKTKSGEKETGAVMMVDASNQNILWNKIGDPDIGMKALEKYFLSRVISRTQPRGGKKLNDKIMKLIEDFDQTETVE